MKQINTVKYWDRKWAEKKTGGNYGQNQYYFLEKFLPKDAGFSALDLGCGRGAGTGWLADKFSKGMFFGVDFSDYAIDVAVKKFKHLKNIFFKSDDVYRFEPGSFDYIIMIELLEHLRFPHDIIQKYFERCNKAIYISIPATNWECEEHIYAYGGKENPLEMYGAEVLGNFNGRKKIIIRR